MQAGGDRGKTLHFLKAEDVRERDWIISHCPVISSAVDTSRYCYKEHVCSVITDLPPFRQRWLYVSKSDSRSGSSTSCSLLISSQWHPTKKKGSRQAPGSVIYTDYQRNMMSKGKLQLCARPTGRQGWEAAQTEWIYLLFM